ncbi:hypothetical protein [Psychrobacillus sp. L4]
MAFSIAPIASSCLPKDLRLFAL